MSVICTGCDKDRDSGDMNAASVGVQINGDRTEVTTFIPYCPECGSLLQSIDQEVLASRVEEIVAKMLKDQRKSAKNSLMRQ